MQVRPAELADLNICYHIDASYTTEYVWQMQLQEDEHALDVRFDTVRLPRSMRVAYPRQPDELLEHWQQDNCFLVAYNNRDDLTGFVDGQPVQNQLWLFNLVVAIPYRRTGVGASLLKAAMRWAVARNLSQLTLEIQTKNYPAISFAHKHGFRFCGFNERYYPNGDIALFFSRSL